MDDQRALPSLLRFIASILVIAIFYYFSARLGLFLALEHTNASPVWPPSGIAFAAIFLLGYRVWPGILTGAFLANLVTFLSHQAAGPAATLAVSVFIGIGNTLEAVIGVVLVRWLIGFKNPFDRAYDVLKFILITFVVCIIAATFGTTSLLASGIVSKNFYNTVWITWWLGDIGGVLIFAPIFLILWFQRSLFGTWQLRQVIEAAIFLVFLFVVGQIICGGEFWIGAHHYPVSFFIIPLVVLAAFRFGQVGVACSILILACLTILNTINGSGPFVMASQNDSLLLLQMFIVTITLTGLFLSAALTEQKEAEARQNQLIKELASVNQELSDFAHVASHDLKAPLRGIGTIIEWLKKDYDPKFDAQGREWLAQLTDRLNLAHALIDGILQYSSVGRQKDRLLKVNLDELVKEIVNVAATGEVDFDVQSQLPDLYCDPIRIRQVFQNLISNAVKYNNKPKKTVRIFCQPEGRYWKFGISDNGPGIDEKYFSKIFQMFETLQPKDKSKSTGIGLPLTKKIVEMYGGKIWVESKLGQGSIFYFTFPR